MDPSAQGPQAARRDVVRALPDELVYIDDAARTGSGGAIEHRHPATAESLGARHLGSIGDIDLAVESAACAHRAWWALDPGHRRDTLFEVARLLRQERKVLAAVVSLEMGTPLATSEAGVARACDWFAYFAGMADKVAGWLPRVSSPGAVLDYAEQLPVGVVGAVIPWNGPVMAAALKLAPALAAGNAVVLKPSEISPFSSLALAKILGRAGLPPGLVNVVAAGADGGARLAAHPDVPVVSFTGGNVGGAAVAAAAAARHARAVLELGGKSAAIVFPDVAVERVAKISLTLGAVQNSGQGCFLPTRVLVHADIYADFVAAVAAAASRVRIGDPFAAGTAMGPVVSHAARDRILAVIAAAQDDEAGTLLVGGHPPTDLPTPLARGSYLLPTVFTDVEPDSDLAQEEVFGPVLSIMRFGTEEEAVALANRSRYGLAGYVWTTDLSRAHRVASALEAGTVSINGMATLHPAAVFSGWKHSGVGAEGGSAGMGEFMRTKNVHVQL